MWEKDMELQDAISDSLRKSPGSDGQVMEKKSSNRDFVSLYSLENLRKKGSDD